MLWFYENSTMTAYACKFVMRNISYDVIVDRLISIKLRSTQVKVSKNVAYYYKI